MITIKLKRLYNGIASLRAKSADHNRDEQYDKAIKAGGCKVVVVDRIMTLSRAVLGEEISGNYEVADFSLWRSTVSSL
jgi:hypothetical protein